MKEDSKKFLYDGDEPSMRRIALLWSLCLLTITLGVMYFSGITVSVQIVTALIGLVIVALGSTTVKKKNDQL